MLISAQSAWAAEYTYCISANRQVSPTSILDMSLNDVTLELWGMRSTALLSSLPDPLWPGVVAPDRVLCMGQIELFDMCANI